MKYLTGNELRQLFLDFFEQKDHKILPSGSLIPVDDPSLLWINSGVAILKKYFDGTVTPDNPRIANSQKSIRTNDIENVGRTARHHTLFEMLGNFSIGEYFKEEAIVWAWEFLTDEKWMAIDPELLYVTIYPDDKEAYRIWHEVVGLPEDHIIKEKGNFWDIGEGPSGPNTEIFYDRGPEFLEEDLPEEENYPGGENSRWLEIWNLVFSQFNHLPDGTYEDLPNQNIDTGMGLERMLSIVQDAPTNFETDLFMPIIKTVETISGQNYVDENLKMSFKVIADHVRAVSFAIADGALPSNEGRGYVLRRLIRRAVMHGRRLGIYEPFLNKLVDVVGQITAEYYPEVVENADLEKKIILNEEKRFFETLHEGSEQLDKVIKNLNERGEKTISGADAFQLYDTFGFPIELTEEIANEQGIVVDHESFDEEMNKQKERARSARSNEQSMSIQSDLLTSLDVEDEFSGYSEIDRQSKLMTIVTDTEVVKEIDFGIARLIFNVTPFYAEKGGQVGDRGSIRDMTGQVVAHVTNVKPGPADQHLHEVEVVKPLQVGEVYQLTVDSERRRLIEKNHTATHLLHQALKDVLGDHVNQAGSLVNENLLRFDFTHFSPVTDDELIQIERIINQKIWDNIQLNTVVTDIQSAKQMGATALFGEKYGDVVRVVTIDSYSKELCGGTHVNSTGDIGLFKIQSESGIGAGTRRIIALTSRAAYQWYEDKIHILDEVQHLTNAQTVEKVPERINSLTHQIKDLEQENESLNAKFANEQADNVFGNVQTIHDIRLIAEEVSVKDMGQLRQLADKWKEQDYSDILVLGLKNGDKVNLIAACKDSVIKQGIKAGDLIKHITQYVKGGGGGRPDLAQAGGSYSEGLKEALAEAKAWLENQL